MTAATPAIVLEGVTKRFGGVVALAGVDLRVGEGEVRALVGPGGAGKSVLLKVACSLLAPDEGVVRIGGADVAHFSHEALADLRRRFGVQFQNYALFDTMSVAENVAFPLRRAGGLPDAEIRERVAARLADVGLTSAAARLPRELSGGMKRRVAVARATIAEPPVVLYDDPTAGLDPVTSSRIFQLIARLQDAGRATVLIASHDVDRLADVAACATLLVHGRVAYDGPFRAAPALDDVDLRAFFPGGRGGTR